MNIPTTDLFYKMDFLDSLSFDKKGSHILWDMDDESSPLINKLNLNKLDTKVEGYSLVFMIDDGFDKRIYGKNNNRIDEIGIELNTAIKTRKKVFYKNPIYFTTRKLIYGAKFSDSTDFEVTLTREELPKDLTEYLPAKVKHIKLLGKVKRSYHYDADGRFNFKEKKVSALRLKVIEHVDLFLYDDTSGSKIPVYDKSILAKIYKNNNGNTYFYYFSNEFRLFFAKSFKLNENDGFIIEYQSKKKERFIIPIQLRKKIFIIFPNPTYGEAKIFFNNYKEGNYELQLFNIIGKRIWKKNVNINDKTLFKIDFSFLHKGTYLLALTDKYGNIVATRKLVIISI